MSSDKKRNTIVSWENTYSIYSISVASTQHLSLRVVIRVLVLLHVHFRGSISEILTALANPFVADLRRDSCYGQRRFTYVRVVPKYQVTWEGPARRLAEPVTCNLPHEAATCKYCATAVTRQAAVASHHILVAWLHSSSCFAQ